MRQDGKQTTGIPLKSCLKKPQVIDETRLDRGTESSLPPSVPLENHKEKLKDNNQQLRTNEEKLRQAIVNCVKSYFSNSYVPSNINAIRISPKPTRLLLLESLIKIYNGAIDIKSLMETISSELKNSEYLTADDGLVIALRKNGIIDSQNQPTALVLNVNKLTRLEGLKQTLGTVGDKIQKVKFTPGKPTTSGEKTTLLPKNGLTQSTPNLVYGGFTPKTEVEERPYCSTPNLFFKARRTVADSSSDTSNVYKDNFTI